MPATVPLVHLGGWLTISFYILNYIFMFVAATDVGLNIVCVSGCVLGEGHLGSMDIKHKHYSHCWGRFYISSRGRPNLMDLKGSIVGFVKFISEIKWKHT